MILCRFWKGVILIRRCVSYMRNIMIKLGISVINDLFIVGGMLFGILKMIFFWIMYWYILVENKVISMVINKFLLLSSVIGILLLIKMDFVELFGVNGILNGVVNRNVVIDIVLVDRVLIL